MKRKPKGSTDLLVNIAEKISTGRQSQTASDEERPYSENRDNEEGFCFEESYEEQAEIGVLDLSSFEKERQLSQLKPLRGRKCKKPSLNNNNSKVSDVSVKVAKVREGKGGSKIPFKYKSLTTLHGKMKLRTRLQYHLSTILRSAEPLLLKDIVEMLRRALDIPWEQEQLKQETILKFIMGKPELKRLYEEMARKLGVPLEIQTEDAKPEVAQYCKRVLQLLQFRMENELFFVWQSEFPTDFLKGHNAKPDPSNPDFKIIFRGVMGSNYGTQAGHLFWDLIDFDQPQVEFAQSLKYIIDSILRQKAKNVQPFLVVSKRFIRLYQETIKYAFQSGINLIAAPPNISTLNPIWYWLKELREVTKKHKICSLKELKMFFHYEHNKHIDRNSISSYFHNVKSFMIAELKKEIDVGFTQSIRSGFRKTGSQ